MEKRAVQSNSTVLLPSSRKMSMWKWERVWRRRMSLPCVNYPLRVTVVDSADRAVAAANPNTIGPEWTKPCYAVQSNSQWTKHIIQTNSQSEHNRFWMNKTMLCSPIANEQSKLLYNIQYNSNPNTTVLNEQRHVLQSTYKPACYTHTYYILPVAYKISFTIPLWTTNLYINCFCALLLRTKKTGKIEAAVAGCRIVGIRRIVRISIVAVVAAVQVPKLRGHSFCHWYLHNELRCFRQSLNVCCLH